MTEPLDATLTIRLPADEKVALEALAADEQKRQRGTGAEVTATSLARGAVRKLLDSAEKRRGRGAR